MNGQPSQQSPEDGTCTARAEQDFTAESFSKTLHKSIPAVEISHSTGSKAYSSQRNGFPKTTAAEGWLHVEDRALGDFSGGFVLIPGHQSAS